MWHSLLSAVAITAGVAVAAVAGDVDVIHLLGHRHFPLNRPWLVTDLDLLNKMRYILGV